MAYAALSTRNGNGLHPMLRGLGFLGDASTPLSPTDAINAAIQAYSGAHLNPAQTQNQAWLSAAESAVANANIDVTGGFGPDCTGQTAQPLNLFQTVSGLALGTTAATVGVLASPSVALIPAAAVPVVGWIVAGVGAIIGLIDAIFEHHAAAVKRDLAFGCSAIPAVNNAMAVIIKGVQNGTILPADAANSLQEIYSQFMAAGGASGSASGPGGIPSGGKAINDSPFCNSNCELSLTVYAMVLYWTAQFQAQAAQAAAVAAEAATQTASQGGSTVPDLVSSPQTTSGFSLSEIPAWGWIALAVVGAWAVAG
jgi:hypothetical protein